MYRDNRVFSFLDTIINGVRADYPESNEKIFYQINLSQKNHLSYRRIFDAQFVEINSAWQLLAIFIFSIPDNFYKFRV